ncbi:MAG: ATP-binding protein [Bacteroidales bacterium]|nr:ATP-binding protein [Bacteroidales bacterium]
MDIRTTDKNGQPIRKSLEVDFVVNEGSQRYYIQSALDMPNQEKVDQEKKVLTEIPDSFKKIIVVKDRIKLKRDEKGIVTMSIFDFLLNPNAINL